MGLEMAIYTSSSLSTGKIGIKSSSFHLKWIIYISWSQFKVNASNGVHNVNVDTFFLKKI